MFIHLTNFSIKAEFVKLHNSIVTHYLAKNRQHSITFTSSMLNVKQGILHQLSQFIVDRTCLSLGSKAQWVRFVKNL